MNSCLKDPLGGQRPAQHTHPCCPPCSRSFIRAAADDEDLPVPSPTFLLQNIYSEHAGAGSGPVAAQPSAPICTHSYLLRLRAGPPIHHFDLYRLTQQYDLARLDLRASFTQAVSLVEWPERLGPDLLPAEHLAVHISILEAAEQQQLQRHLAAAAAHERRSTDEAEGGGDEGGGDTRWRRIQLSPAGQRWLPRLQLLHRYLSSEGAELGCYLERSTL